MDARKWQQHGEEGITSSSLQVKIWGIIETDSRWICWDRELAISRGISAAISADSNSKEWLLLQILFGNRINDKEKAKYLEHVVRSHGEADDDAYKCVTQQTDPEGKYNLPQKNTGSTHEAIPQSEHHKHEALDGLNPSQEEARCKPHTDPSAQN
ncbi:hypothetical protein EJ110_NYTH08164 [Nymphaea thermarum]|nr:hypothetical protein EJ110_NYTH08164 [Nymphaea thermarum]